jgi:enamine deaminase RidA (YjgF/YER057c/UK114 family)
MSTASSFVTPLVEHDGLVFVSGQLPRIDGQLAYPGQVGASIDIEAARAAAELSARACLSVLRDGVGDRFVRLLKITGFIASAPDFTAQGRVLDAASAIFIDALGEAGVHARSAVGVMQLPHGGCVEIELVAAVRP